jgi:cytidylate kinase
VADRLGLRILGKEMINLAACKAGVPEVALAELDELGLLGIRPQRSALEQYEKAVTGLMEEAAVEGKVLIVGRGGQVHLAKRHGVLHVQVIAPLEQRVRRVAKRCSTTPEVALAMVEARDRVRAAYVHRCAGTRWDDPSLYDLVLNTGQLGIAGAADIVCLAATRVTAAA